MTIRRFHIPFIVLVGGAILCFGGIMAPSRPAHAQASPYAAADEAYKKKDYITAHRLWLTFAEQGNRTAYFNLGRMYYFGEGVAIDLIESYKWFLLADRAGFAHAKAGLARVGRLMTKSDVAEAKRRVERWYDLYPRTRR